MSTRFYHKKDWWLSVRDSGKFNEITKRCGDYMYGVCTRYEFPETHEKLRKARQASKRPTIKPRLNEPLSKRIAFCTKWSKLLINVYPFSPDKKRRRKLYFRPKKALKHGQKPILTWGGRMDHGLNIKLRKTRGRRTPDYPFYRRVLEHNRSSLFFKKWGYPGG